MGNQQGRPGRSGRKRSRQDSGADTGPVHEEKRRPQADWPADREVPGQPGQPSIVPRTEDAESEYLYEQVPEHGIVVCWDPPANATANTGYLLEASYPDGLTWISVTEEPVFETVQAVVDLTPGQTYIFRVTAQNRRGSSAPSVPSDSVQISLRQKSDPEPPVVLRTLRDATCLQHDKASFTIQFTGSPLPTVHWYKNKERVQPDDRCQVVTLGERSSLLLHPVLLEDAGTVTCELINPIGSVSSSARLLVEAPPSLRVPEAVERGLTFAVDEVIRVCVPYLGRPVPTFTWMRGDQELSAEVDSRVVTSCSDTEASLRVSDAGPSDSGQYTLRAVSDAGGDVAVFNIAVKGAPGPPGQPQLRHLSSKCLTIDWTAPEYDGGAKITKYLVEYFRVGWDVWLKAVTSRSRLAQVFDLTVGSEVKFRVRAENSYGVGPPGPDSVVCTVPEPTEGEDDFLLDQLSVSSRAASELSLSREEVLPSPKRPRSDQIDSAVLPPRGPAPGAVPADGPVRPAVTSDPGQGHRARPRSPSAGRGGADRPRGVSPFYREDSQQKAVEPPLLTVPSEPMVGYIGETTIITVGLEGPITSLTWHHDGQPLVEDDHYHIRRVAEGTQLSVAHTAPGDAGSYTVTARNSAGRSAAQLRLELRPARPTAGDDAPPPVDSDDYTPFVRRGRPGRTDRPARPERRQTAPAAAERAAEDGGQQQSVSDRRSSGQPAVNGMW
ncbi:twitchin-like [Amphibalanus amphitrite]|uniref:twitchin-like n=1 Tax=Amphibalanus amphitrite TaxID=1232801 RepID=UPI001C9132C9|nr:twitchin-like [Amphibalanus amphitrite]